MKENDDSRISLAVDTAGAKEVERALERLYVALEDLLPVLVRGSKGVRVKYQVEDVGTLSHLIQEEYSLEAEDLQVPRFVLSFRCVGRQALTYKASTVDEKERLRVHLAQFDLEFGINDLSSWRYVLAVQPVVTVRMVFEPAPDRAAIRVTIYNLSRLGVERYSIEPEAVGPELLEELCKLILRQDNTFADFTGNRVPAEMRERLQARLRRRAVSREKEDRPRGLDEPPPAAPSRLRRLLARKEQQAAKSAPSSTRGGSSSGKEQEFKAMDEIEWESSAEAGPQAATGEDDAGRKHAQGSEPALAQRSSGNKASPDASPEPTYAWMITQGLSAEHSATELGRLGPVGAARRFTIPKVLTVGEEFRLVDREGTVRFSGKIAGEYEGVEPVVDFGIGHDCFVIEYLRDGRWVRVRVSR